MIPTPQIIGVRVKTIAPANISSIPASFYSDPNYYCGGSVRVIADASDRCIEDEDIIDRILGHKRSAIQLLAEQPHMCRERLELAPPVRIHHHAHHLIVYLALEDGINVVRVLHENMDYESQLE